MSIRHHIETAIALAGSQGKLAKAAGCSQHAIWRAKTVGRISGELAVKIDRATAGKVAKHALRPDLFSEAAA
jgi:DNA-binding transcriptional regulator YdaS (Cro superfamily)